MIKGFFRKIAEIFGIKKNTDKSNSGFDYNLQRLEKESDAIVLPYILDIRYENDIIEKDIRVKYSMIVGYYLDKLFETISDCVYSDNSTEHTDSFEITNRKLNINVVYNSFRHYREYSNVVLNVFGIGIKKIEIHITNDKHLDRFRCLLLVCKKLHEAKVKNESFIQKLNDLELVCNKISEK